MDALVLLRWAWPFVLAGAIWFAQETRVVAAQHSALVSEKRAADAESKLIDARQRATDIALLYAHTLPKIEEAARVQKEKDDAQITTLTARVEKLSHAPTVYLSADALRLFDYPASAGDGGNAGAGVGATGRAPAVAESAAPAAGGYYSEADIAGHDVAAHGAYLACVRMFHAVRDQYNAARAAQLKGNAQ